jgi:hypothetical protein
VSWWRSLLGQEKTAQITAVFSEPPLVASVGRRRPMPLAGGSSPDELADEPPDQRDKVRTVIHLFCNGTTCSHT